MVRHEAELILYLDVFRQLLAVTLDFCIEGQGHMIYSKAEMNDQKPWVFGVLPYL